MTINNISLLILDPAQQLTTLSTSARKRGWHVAVVQHVTEIPSVLAGASPEAVVIDTSMEEYVDALQLVQQAKTDLTQQGVTILLADGSDLLCQERIGAMLRNIALEAGEPDGAGESAGAGEAVDTRHQTQQGLAYLDEVLRIMVDLPSNEPVLKAVARGMRLTIDCDSVTIYGYDQGADRFISRPLVTSGDPYPAELGQQDLNTADIALAVRQQKAVYRDANSPPEAWHSSFATRRGLQASAAILLETPKGIVGLLFINYLRSHVFSETDKNLIRIFAKQAIVAIQLTELQHEQDQQRIQQLQDLFDATQVIIDSIEEGDIYGKLLQQAINLTGAAGEPAFMANIQIYEQEHDELVLRYIYPESMEKELQQPRGYRVRLRLDDDGEPAGISKRAIQENRPLLIPNVKAHPDYIAFHADTNCLIVTPLIHERQLRGVLTVAHRQPDGLVESDRNVLEMLARQAMLAVEKSEHIEELGARAELIWLDIASGIAGHSMKNKVRTIWFTAQGLRDTIAEKITSDECARLDAIVTACQGVLSEKFDLDSIHDNLKLCEPHEIHALVLNRIQTGIEDAEMSIEQRAWLMDDSVANRIVRVGEEFLRHAVDIIIDNAIRAMGRTPPERPNMLTLSTEVAVDFLRISIGDTGPGIPSDILNSMFREIIKGGPGNGVGLLVARTIVSAYGGEIESPQTGSDGTTITIRLPLTDPVSLSY